MTWWELEIPNIRDEHSSYLRRRLPALSADHDDLINDGLLALTRQLYRGESAWPAAWFQHDAQPTEAERAHLHKLAMVILKRRIADLFRKRRVRRMIVSLPDEELKIPRDDLRRPDRTLLLTRILEVTASALDEMKPQDRDLIALISDDGFRKSLNQRERKRLQRIRAKLEDKVARRLGASVADLLRLTL